MHNSRHRRHHHRLGGPNNDLIAAEAPKKMRNMFPRIIYYSFLVVDDGRSIVMFTGYAHMHVVFI